MFLGGLTARAINLKGKMTHFRRVWNTEKKQKTYQDIFNTANFLVHFVALVDQRFVLNVMMLEISLQILSINALDFVINNGNASSKGLVNAGQSIIFNIQNSEKEIIIIFKTTHLGEKLGIEGKNPTNR